MGLGNHPMEAFFPEAVSMRPHYFPGEAIEKKEMDGFTLLIPKYQSDGVEVYQAVAASFSQLSEERRELSNYTPRLIAIRHQNFSLKVPSPHKAPIVYGKRQLLDDAFTSNYGNQSNTDQIHDMRARIAGELNRLEIKSVSIDSCPHKCEIEFKMDLGNGLYVTAMTDKDMYDERVVEFTVAVDGELLLVNTLPIDELCDTLAEIQKELASI